MSTPSIDSLPSENGPRDGLPRAPRAWAGAIQFLAEAFVEWFGFVRLLVAFVLVFIGVGIWMLPGAIDFAGAHADRSRALARRLPGVTVEGYRRPVTGQPGPWQVLHTWQRLKDPVVRRDVLWHMLNPIVGIPLGIMSLGLVLEGAWELVSMPFEVFFSSFRPATWFTIADAMGMPLAAGIGATLVLIAVQVLIGIALARPLLRAQGGWSRLVLHVEDAGQWRRRAATLEATRADVLDLEQAELQRIERDLHDGAQMRFVSTGLTITEAARLVRDDPDRAIELLSQAKGESAAGLAELRRLVRGIRPPVLADRGLVDAIRAIAKDTAIPTVVTSTLSDRLAAPLESALYFAVAEVLTNAVKHAKATGLRVNLSETSETVTLLVTDDGQGGAQTDPDHGGLAGIRRRLSTFDGSLSVLSPEGGPTVVTIAAPNIKAASV
ncbi:sensor domain-containing protein [Rugosimonospora acidiphila]|uniref:histidine kinase n=1 Tax=Rugosimonospora acidiphila TaxID=556531 RepID=A0ABP9SU53_9ACTN